MDHTLRCPTCLVDWVFTSDELRRLLIGQDIDGDALVEIESCPLCEQDLDLPNHHAGNA